MVVNPWIHVQSICIAEAKNVVRNHARRHFRYSNTLGCCSQLKSIKSTKEESIQSYRNRQIGFISGTCPSKNNPGGEQISGGKWVGPNFVRKYFRLPVVQNAQTPEYFSNSVRTLSVATFCSAWATVSMH